ncbi:hypothetical protein [Peribacillus loiseleuriae]|nr:hypothetical protein [Peribacillus loiseleuriae]
MINQNESEWEQTKEFVVPIEEQIIKQQELVIHKERLKVIIDGKPLIVNG